MKIYLRELKKYVELSGIKSTRILESLNSLGFEVKSFKPIIPQEKLKVGKIISIRKHPQAERLNITETLVEGKKYKIICGADNVEIGKYVIVALVGTNIESKPIQKLKIKGIESEGMICSLSEIGIESNLLSEDENNGIYTFLNTPKSSDAIKELSLNDYVIELDIPINRNASLSYKGIANELSWKLNSKLKFNYSYNYPKVLNNSVKGLIKEGASSYNLIELSQVEFNHSNWDIKSTLIASNIKYSNNNFVDYSKYLSLIFKQPITVYDADKVGTLLTVKKIKPKGAIDNNDINVNSKLLCVVNGNNSAVSIAGIVVFDEFRVSLNTKRVLIESAVFNKDEISISENVLDIKDSITLIYKKDLTNENSALILNAFSKSIIESEWAKNASKVLEYNLFKNIENKVKLNISNVNSYLGKILSSTEIIKLLEKNNIKNIKKNNSELIFSIPNDKVFINSEESLIEELIRIYGIENINAMPSIEKLFINNKNLYDNRIEKIRTYISNNGFNEIVSYSLIDEQNSNSFNYFKYKDLIRLSNDYKMEKNIMRGSLVDSLMKASLENKKHKKEISKLFEISEIYYENGKSQSTHLGCLIKGNHIENVNMNLKIESNIFLAKRVIQNLLFFLNVRDQINFKKFKTKNNLYQENKIFIGNVNVGVIVNNLDNDEVIFELNLSLLINKINNEIKIKDISNSNINYIDYSFDTKNIDNIRMMIDSIKKIDLTRDAILLDIFENKSYLIRIIYQDKDKTMTHQEKEKFNLSILKIFKERKIKLNYK